MSEWMDGYANMYMYADTQIYIYVRCINELLWSSSRFNNLLWSFSIFFLILHQISSTSISVLYLIVFLVPWLPVIFLHNKTDISFLANMFITLHFHHHSLCPLVHRFITHICVHAVCTFKIARPLFESTLHK